MNFIHSHANRYSSIQPTSITQHNAIIALDTNCGNSSSSFQACIRNTCSCGAAYTYGARSYRRCWKQLRDFATGAFGPEPTSVPTHAGTRDVNPFAFNLSTACDAASCAKEQKKGPVDCVDCGTGYSASR